MDPRGDATTEYARTTRSMTDDTLDVHLQACERRIRRPVAS
jgi:hypothetical protein